MGGLQARLCPFVAGSARCILWAGHPGGHSLGGHRRELAVPGPFEDESTHGECGHLVVEHDEGGCVGPGRDGAGVCGCSTPRSVLDANP